ncbi:MULTISPECIES: ferrochelatase [unclassified Enterococcus]|uniref:ferrochelatase n=1 Tax=unclassified Enterococcus TaxID=2608891 RepID=UPI0015523261|nr:MULTISPECIES: ferrochelatase [unclassified Enterococcus]MBS7577511.1 ferrochelatase [Enterococcus sp. MMGLQ5-2]MBS7584990.1 ferrochelatase [Enterococcus sp. MMGLQ5-1]NPD12845.1 ferrochelatase [Enterococcus sp. MMGLQ5-1]NPD37344.1 ferrochelatase [Enterococcus sp. MMGLQ5-2]
MKNKAVLLINLGSPESSNPKHVKTYLAQFLADQRVIKTPRIIWLPILHGMILKTRPKKSAKLYQQIEHNQKFPLIAFAEQQKNNLQKLLPEIKIEIAMSYGKPSISQKIDALISKGVTDLTVIPMYPQYSGTTVGAIFDEIMKAFIGTDQIVNLRFIRSFFDHPIYINYYVHKLKEKLATEKPDLILFSYHGIPASYVKDGDTYPEECTKTTELIMEALPDIPYLQTYQSKFGPAKWLTPATDATLKSLPHDGIKNIFIVAPGFVADCLETTIELEVENKAYFMENGGEKFTYIHPFNADRELAELFQAIINGY